MRNGLIYSLLITVFIILSQSSCNTNNDPLVPADKVRGARSGASTNSTASCGQYFNESYYGNGYYAYPSKALNFSGVCNGATVAVSFDPMSVPNRFSIRDNNNNVVLQSSSPYNGWLGTTSYPGPWGSSGFSTGGSQTPNFIYDSSKTYTLVVETSTTQSGSDQGAGNDNWAVTISCGTCPEEPPTGTPCAGCGQYFNESYYGNGYYAYPSKALNFSGVCNGTTVAVSFDPMSVPNRFSIRDNNNNVVLQSSSPYNGWLGTTSYPGPWGSSGFSTGGSQTPNFIYDSSKTYTLVVETSTTQSGSDQGAGNDNWAVTISCSR